MNLGGKIKEQQMHIKYIFNWENVEDMTQLQWFDFNRGVAEGLKYNIEEISKQNMETIWIWIEYQCGKYNSQEQAGLLFSLGLRSLFKCFTITDIY